MNKKILTSVIIGVIIILGLIYSNKITGENKNKEVTYNNISSEELEKIMNEEEIYLIDVHIPEQQHIKGTDAFIPYNEISNSEKLPKDENTKIVVYCRSGSMSLEAAKTLTRMGYKNVLNLEKGINEWKQKGLPLEE